MISGKADRLVRAFKNAAQNQALKGAAHPDSWDDIERDYKITRQKLLRYIEQLEQQYYDP